MPWFDVNIMHERDLQALYYFIKYLGAGGQTAFVPPDKEPSITLCALSIASKVRLAWCQLIQFTYKIAARSGDRVFERIFLPIFTLWHENIGDTNTDAIIIELK
jgi:hypothetical protein